MTEPYHRYVFDEKNRKPVLQFEEMYKAEDIKNFDSWHKENTTSFGKQLALAILNQYNWDKILDIGCGKGCFTHLLKKDNNFVVGIDISKTAIEREVTEIHNNCKRMMILARNNKLVMECLSAKKIERFS